MKKEKGFKWNVCSCMMPLKEDESLICGFCNETLLLLVEGDMTIGELIKKLKKDKGEGV